MYINTIKPINIFRLWRGGEDVATTLCEETPAPALLHSDNPKYRKSPQYSFGSTDRRCDLDHMPYADGVQISESDRMNDTCCPMPLHVRDFWR
eukprot:5458780-Amphidinium_carterae.1